MDSVYVRQLQHYSIGYLNDLLGEDIQEKLSYHSIVKYDAGTGQYQFHYVGVIIVDDMVINCFPKYIHDKQNIKDDFKQVINVIKKYEASNEDVSYDDIEIENISFNLLPMMLFFIEDYYENGVYTRIRNILEENGDGEIDWDRTVNNNVAYLIEDKPFYTQLDTKYKINDLYDYFRMLHEYIITECSKYLEKRELLDLFDLTPVELSENSLEDFGQLDFILNRLQKELNIEFNTHKRKLLQVMYSYLSNKNIFNENDNLVLYGTTAYHDVWEKICKFVFNDKLNKKLSKLKLPTHLNEKYDADDELLNVIKRPVWMLNDKAPRESDTFIPDIVTIKDDKFTILDAKYYDLKLDDVITGQPGLESITKQYLYELAFKEFIQDHGFKTIKNAFLFPTQKTDISNEGKVTLEILNSLGLEDIQIIMLPVHLMYECYLKNHKLNISTLKLD
ncbi:LlaJI family restriction endonuclease [Methanosphaera sp. BMS]|uniref:LlaJI family restriction endonuclease n=1 Tax=Methanosphaera sp. BMS TaxID=1789762 RepID=UPI000DC1E294|nr:LlaJI family restriction endonuclease [Methanosphaera sp. BMS]AWX31832.1 hypothetical protein AW729_01440 [Methanosphaera sp. BMS]